ncbi:MAG: RNA polymerase sigma factor [Steroidobacteraceae bacterium]|jgi:RNA polymerase sigma factor (sigma-70 family)
MDQALPLPARSKEDNARISAAVAAQKPRLQAFVRRQLGDWSEVDDIVQETFLELVTAYRLMEPIEHLTAWLMRVARNRIIDRFRSRSRAMLVSADPLPDTESLDEPATILDSLLAPEASGPESSYLRGVLADELIAAVEELPPAQREVFIAHELHGRSFRELAATSGVGLNTLLGRKHDAVRFLRTRLKAIESEFN